MMSWFGLHKLVDVIFGITRKTALSYIMKLGQVNISLVKEFFWTCFVTWRVTGDEFQTQGSSYEVCDCTCMPPHMSKFT